jgi:formylglycine-generating enzyme required for sulfatase activity
MCAGGVCKISQCTPYYEDCDSVDANGCEVALWTDPNNCNSCGAKCDATGGTPSCVLGACKIACSSGYGDCDGDVSNGCETNTTTSSHCGVCGIACTGDQVCSNNTCIAPSCAGGAKGQADCGPGKNGSCCVSLPVPGGTVQLEPGYSATVSDYRLDEYEITVGRFRKFVDAWVGGWRPSSGAGKHTHLNGGSGLSDGSGGYEPGWDTAWSANLKATKGEWDSVLSCDASSQTWTSSAGVKEKRPISCVSWYETAAFCIWDGGFLPSEAEWQYAAAGGSENRQYPWGVTAPTSSLAIYATSSTQDVGSKPMGNGRWGHSDLAGNVWEWALDWYKTPYPLATSANYANISAASGRVLRGGSFGGNASYLLASNRNVGPLASHGLGVGARCARTP